MRIVYFLSGMPGSGKSTMISKNELDGLTLSLDSLRKIYSGLSTNQDGMITLSQEQNDFVFNRFLEALDFRLELGAPIIIDNLNPSLKDIESSLKLIKKYDYDYKIVEFPLEDLDFYLKRNSGREAYKRLSENKLEKLHSIFKSRNFNPESIISIADFEKEICATPEDLIRDVSHYNKIHFIGDLQGCYTPLKEYFTKEEINENDLYVFLGDYIDRGIENAECLEFILEHLYSPNFIFIMGNHEENLYRYSNNLKKQASDDFIVNTLPALSEANIDKEKMKEIYKGLKLFEFLQFKDKKLFISHGGLPTVPEKPRMLNYNDYLRGYGPYNFNIDERFDKLNKGNEWYQIHGHRNFHKLTFNSYEKSFALEADIEFGGNLTILRLDESGFEGIYINNKVFNRDAVLEFEEKSNMFTKKTTVNNLTSFIKNKVNCKKSGLETIQDLRTNNSVKEYISEVHPHISSFEIDQGSFSNENNETIIKCKNIIYNNKTGDIIARDFDKMIDLKETSLISLENYLSMPLNLFQKENGSLGILGYDSETNTLIFSSKFNKGKKEDNFENLIKQQLTEGELEYLKIFANRHNVSYLFEVNDSLNDPHIIKHDEQKAILLSVVKRDLTYSEMNYDNLISLSIEIKGLQIKKKSLSLNDFKSLKGFIKSVDNESAFETKRKIEGFVIQDSKLNMVKFKVPYYNFWLQINSFVDKINNRKETGEIFNIEEQVNDNNLIQAKDKVFAINFLNYFNDLPMDKKKNNIISLRCDFMDINKNKKLLVKKNKPWKIDKKKLIRSRGDVLWANIVHWCFFL